MYVCIVCMYVYTYVLLCMHTYIHRDRTFGPLVERIHNALPYTIGWVDKVLEKNSAHISPRKQLVQPVDMVLVDE